MSLVFSISYEMTKGKAVKKNFHIVWIYVISGLLFISYNSLSMQRGSQSLVNLAVASYIKKLTTMSAIPSQEELDKLMPKELQPMITQMLVKPVLEYLRDRAFRDSSLINQKLLFPIPDNGQSAFFDDSKQRLLLITPENHLSVIDIAAASVAYKNSKIVPEIFSLDSQVTAVLSGNGLFVASLGIDGIVRVYNLFSGKLIYSLTKSVDKINGLRLNKLGSLLFLLNRNHLSIIDVPLSKTIMELADVADCDTGDNGVIVVVQKTDKRTFITIDTQQKKQIAERVIENIIDFDLSLDETKIALLRFVSEENRFIDTLSSYDLKIMQSLPVSFIENIEFSPQARFIVCYETEHYELFDYKKTSIVRASDGHLVGREGSVFIENVTFNNDETRATISSNLSYLNLYDLMIGGQKFESLNLDRPLIDHISTESVLIVNNIGFIDDYSFLTIVTTEEGHQYLIKISLPPTDVLEQFKNLSLPQAWLIRRGYDDRKKHQDTVMNDSMNAIYSTLPEKFLQLLEKNFIHFTIPKPIIEQKMPIKNLIPKPNIFQTIKNSFVNIWGMMKSWW